MEFPFAGLTKPNSSETALGGGRSLYERAPVVAAPYVVLLGVAAVLGTLGNLVVIAMVTIKHRRRRRRRAGTSANGAGWAFVANLALSDLTVTAVINPLAIAGLCPLIILYLNLYLPTSGSRKTLTQ